jgi:nucleotide-binding universal stress UspA family protein
VRFETLVLESEMPSVAITTHVKFSGADLVVMGTRGHSPMASYFLGTNAERLLHDASVSVLAVR